MIEEIQSGTLAGATITHQPAQPGRVEYWVLTKRGFSSTVNLIISPSGHVRIEQVTVSGSADGSYFEEEHHTSVHLSVEWLQAALALLLEKAKGE